MKYLSIVLSLFFSAAILQADSGGPPATPVVVSKVKMETIKKNLKVSGRIVARKLATLSPQQSGLVQEIAIEAGQWVKTGQVLLRLDAERASLAVAAVKAEVDVTKSELQKLEKLAKLQKEEFNDLIKAEKQLAGSVSKSELRSAESRLVELEGQVAINKAQLIVLMTQLKQAELTLVQHTLTAPFDGQVLKKNVAKGNWLLSGQAAFSLIDSNDLEVQLDCPDHLFFILEQGLKTLDINLDESKKSFQIVDIIARREVDARSKTFQVIGVPKTSDVLLVHGMTVSADIPSQADVTVKTLPYNAILKNDVGSFVYKVAMGQNGAMVLPIPVKVLFKMDHRAAIESMALQTDDQVVTEGGERLFPMTPVAVKEAVQ